jgi:hypothetical protein
MLQYQRAPNNDFIHRCIQERRRWLDSGGKSAINPELMDEIKMRTLIELADFARSKFPNLSDDLIWENARDIRQAKESAEKCDKCRIRPEECSTGGYRFELVIQGGAVNAVNSRCSVRDLAWGDGKRKAG